jgi:hypothetical protein
MTSKAMRSDLGRKLNVPSSSTLLNVEANMAGVHPNKTEQAENRPPVSREELYELVWKEPMLRVAERFGVSSSFLARVCTRLNVPRPRRGYWARLAVGKVGPRPNLPPPAIGAEIVWVRDGSGPIVSKQVVQAPVDLQASPIRRRPEGAVEHALVVGAKAHFESARESWDVPYLKPAKRNIVDVVVTKGALEKALVFANELFLTLETNKYRVMLAEQRGFWPRVEPDLREDKKERKFASSIWRPAKVTVVYIGTVAIGLCVSEMFERVTVRYAGGKYVRVSDVEANRRRPSIHEWTTEREMPSGRLRLLAYSPYSGVNWTREWDEYLGRNLGSRIPSILRELRLAVPDLVRLIGEAEVQAQIDRERRRIEHEKWEIERVERRAMKAQEESIKGLKEAIALWGEVQVISSFFADVERTLEGLAEAERDRLLERLRLARELIGSIDALPRFMSWKSPEERLREPSAGQW